jgi:hypothetical protein
MLKQTMNEKKLENDKLKSLGTRAVTFCHGFDRWTNEGDEEGV